MPDQHLGPAEAAAAVDTRLEQALEAVLIRYGVPADGMEEGGWVADRGDLASDLARVAREHFGTTPETEGADRVLVSALVGRHLSLYHHNASFHQSIQILARFLLPALVDGLAMRAGRDELQLEETRTAMMKMTTPVDRDTLRRHLGIVDET